MLFSYLASTFLPAIPHNVLPQQPLTQTPPPFDWDSIPPNPHIAWHDCFSKFHCARLRLPLDWKNPSPANHTVSLALIKVPATVPVTSPSYGGPVLLNPGGPGGSGVNQVLKTGYDTRTILSAGPSARHAHPDHRPAKHFDIIGFDPRGVNNSRPMLACFPDHRAAALWSLENAAHGVPGTAEGGFDYAWASRRAVAEGCSGMYGGEDGIARHMSTAVVARDMVEIVERLGEWREGEARRLVAEAEGEEGREVLERVRYRPGKEMVQYWGFSYGTILGATLLSMFPERIGRAVLDGVADSFDYMAAGWRTNLHDTDRLIGTFTQHCLDGGAENCPIYDPAGSQAIQAKLKETAEKLIADPISIPATPTCGPRVLTWNDLIVYIFAAVYSPLIKFPEAATIFHELSARNATSFVAWKDKNMPPYDVPLSDQCLKGGPYSPACNAIYAPEILDGVACGEGTSLTSRSKAEYRSYAEELMKQSVLLGASWAQLMIPCTAWHARAAWRYEGDFNSRPAHPPLFIGNTIDPVTPLRNAYKMAKGFHGAGVLEIEAEGHCSSAGLSMCAGKAIRNYFQTGELPDVKICGVDRKPLDGYTRDTPVEDIELPAGETDEELWRAMIGVNR